MTSTPDETLSETSPGAAFGIEDVTEAPSPEDFSWDDFLAGVRSQRRAVKIHPRADLVATMEELAGEYARLDDQGAKAADKRTVAAKFETARAEFHDTARWFVVEARSSDWVKKFREAASKRHGVTLPEEGERWDEALQPVLLEQVAAQVLTPAGVTAEGLARLGEVAEGELNKLIAAVTIANSQIAGAAQVASPDFSLGRSASRPPSGSKKPSGRR